MEAISRLKDHEADLQRLGVQRLYLFGSTARGEARHPHIPWPKAAAIGAVLGTNIRRRRTICCGISCTTIFCHWQRFAAKS